MKVFQRKKGSRKWREHLQVGIASLNNADMATKGKHNERKTQFYDVKMIIIRINSALISFLAFAFVSQCLTLTD